MSEQLDIRRHNGAAIFGTALMVAIVAVIGFSVVYAGKIYPGVRVDGVAVGGLSRSAAMAAIQAQATSYANQQLTIHNGSDTITMPVSALKLQYTDQGVTNALKWGRQGSLTVQIRDRVRALLGRPTTFSSFTYSDAKILPIVAQLDDAAAVPVANATLSFSNGNVGVTPEQPGQRLDRGLLIMDLEQQLAAMGTAPVSTTIYAITPTINAAALATTQSQAAAYAAAPISLQIGGTTQSIDRTTILSWLDVSTPTRVSDLPLNPLIGFYDVPLPPTVNLTLNQADVGGYVQNIASRLNQPPQNAVLAWQNNAVTVVTPSRPGVSFDQTKAAQQIVVAARQPATNRNVTVAATTTPADVNENNLASLGITSQISEGQTTFPGSSAARLTNVRVGAAKYNQVLLKPGEQFSFGKILGDVGPAQGYLPELVILGNHEEKQYGGGLCQVASTAFRAALLAGLPINQRSNHSFAVSYYTAPYGVPGVDATIYYPQVDLKFTNDTGHYILIQTIMTGTSLTFDFYGTKTKSGVIRGPNFITGSTDAKQASQTVFYRDVLDPNGVLIKTDTFRQSYQPSTNFPIEQTTTGA